MGENRKLFEEFQSLRDKLRGLEETMSDKIKEVDESMGRIQVLLQTPLKTVGSSKKDYSALNFATNTSTYISTTNIISDTITIATTTGTTSTILPSDELNLHTDTTTTTYTTNNNSNNIVDSIVYVEDDDYYSNSDDDAFLSSEDYDFVSSIQSTAFIGICLPPVLWNTSDISSLVTTILPKLQNNACQFRYLITVTRPMLSFKTTSVATNLRNYYNHIIRLTIYDILQYRIFFWDPGILYITNFYFYFTIYLLIP